MRDPVIVVPYEGFSRAAPVRTLFATTFALIMFLIAFANLGSLVGANFE